MKVVLRNTQTGHYLQLSKQWTHDSREALDFCHIDRAIKTACEARLEGVEVVCIFEHPAYDLRLPIR
jgi:hypothetical protein